MKTQYEDLRLYWIHIFNSTKGTVASVLLAADSECRYIRGNVSIFIKRQSKIRKQHEQHSNATGALHHIVTRVVTHGDLHLRRKHSVTSVRALLPRFSEY